MKEMSKMPFLTRQEQGRERERLNELNEKIKKKH
jgi:hypothetical protein